MNETPQETLPAPPQAVLPPPPRHETLPLPPPPPQTRQQRALAKARARMQALLEPGEQIRSLFTSQTGPSPRGALSLGSTSLLMRYWTVAVTDRNIVLCASSWNQKPVRLPLEPMEILEEKSSRWWFPVHIGGKRHWVGMGDYDTIVAANELLRAEPPAAALPAPPSAPAPPAAPEAAAVRPAPPAPAPPTPPPPPAATPAAWYPDPGGRHQQRYWDGQRWTDHVADQGTQGSDPLAS